MTSKVIMFLFISTIMLFNGCTNQIEEKPLRWLEDIRFDKQLDKKDFIVCDEDNVYQYFHLGNGVHYEGDKPAIINHFMENYDDSKVKKESGLIRVRFIVNCQGETDRFRMIQSDLSYKEKIFDAKITDQIMSLTKSMDKWELRQEENGNLLDYWQFLVFKIVDGKIKKITP